MPAGIRPIAVGDSKWPYAVTVQGYLNCYKYQCTILFDEFKEQNGEGFMKEYWRRHIVAFSPEADRILLVTYINPPYGMTALYDIYDNGSISIPLYWNSYVYPLTLFFRNINYTKALKYATLSHVVNIGEIYPFYNSPGLLQTRMRHCIIKQILIQMETNV